MAIGVAPLRDRILAALRREGGRAETATITRGIGGVRAPSVNAALHKLEVEGLVRRDGRFAWELVRAPETSKATEGEG